MAKEISFSRNTDFLGRNGTFSASGLSIGASYDDSIALRPITSKGAIGRATLNIPTEDLPDVISTLQSFLPNSVVPAK
jgi:hypothetical protein